MVCLEIFLTPHDVNEPIANSIAEAAAIILSEKDRISSKEKIKKFYRIRSDIVHGRKTELNKNKVYEIRNDLQELIHWMINSTDSFESTKDLVETIAQYKLEGEVFRP